jgi:hypothetical protein
MSNSSVVAECSLRGRRGRYRQADAGVSGAASAQALLDTFQPEQESNQGRGQQPRQDELNDHGAPQHGRCSLLSVMASDALLSSVGWRLTDLRRQQA